MTDSVDLYRPPEAALEQPLDTPLDGLPSPSTWLVLFLGIITMGIYLIWWLYSRSVAVNRTSGATVIGAGYTMVLPALYAVNLAISTTDGALALGLYEQYGMLSVALAVFNLGIGIANIVWTFEVRKHLRVLCGDSVRIGPVLTFFIGPLYLNYKIREIKALAQPAQTQVSEPGYTAALPA